MSEAAALFSAIDYRHMQRALALAERGRFTAAPNPCVGCVIAVGEQVIGEGFHWRAGTAHAEVNALQSIKPAERALLSAATAYVTLEPCSHHGRTPPCADALIAARVARVVVATLDPYHEVAGRGIDKLRAAGIAVDIGLLSAEAQQQNQTFFSRVQRGRPWLRLKMAASLDGNTALANGKSQWITSPDARADVQLWRAQSHAILSTAATVIGDNARLTARPQWTLEQRQQQPELAQWSPPLRIILDRQGQLTPDLAAFAEAGPIMVVCSSAAKVNYQQFDWPAQVNFEVLDATSAGFELSQVFHRLGELSINSVWTECGARLAGSLVASGMVDEFILYLAPKLLGAGAQPMFAGTPLESLAQATELKLVDVRQIGPDIRIIAHAKR